MVQGMGGGAHSRAQLLLLTDHRAPSQRAVLRVRPVLLAAHTAASLAQAGPVRPAAAAGAVQARLPTGDPHKAGLQRVQSSSSLQHCRRLLRTAMHPEWLAQRKGLPHPQ